MQTVEEPVLSEARIAPRHTYDAHDVHRHKDRVDADECDPEVNLPDSFIHEAPKHLREPEIERREHAEDRSHAHHEVEVSSDDVSVVHCQIERALPKYQSGDTTRDK